jgi:glycosyltransferase involved in cell wall biosynthesis
MDNLQKELKKYMITVILNCYKRTQYLQEQIQSIRNQTIPVDDIWIWYNKPEDSQQYDLSELGCKVVTCNHNFKFHGRFALGLLAKTEYLAYFDDDTIPGLKWFENCLSTIESGYDGILGTSGVVLNTNNAYQPNVKFGWNGHRLDTVKQVDLVGHAWFFNKKYLKYLWYQEPIMWENGEDMQFSFFSQKYGNIKTYVPPHPVSDISVWGSHPAKGEIYGADANGSSNSKNGQTHLQLRNKCVDECVKAGWKLINF